ncbi:MAG: dihydroorotate dehydrogenase electron transfer subunit [Verrucomicrobiota bacterium]|jgi:dihydroorotate dehydrogenase electron transfer subunit|nr:dihydroorotate dehydrogenase electron transfer subunit [Verrucomicrobiota bacterium]MDK2963377.1 dihydroorotate dehydrogenase electron transfer subunit [Verrucomicrobiota bacterium]
MIQEKTTVLEHRIFHGDYRLLKLSAPLVGPQVRPGQFVHIRIPRLEHAVLRRPFSVFKANADSLSVLYKSVGKGTEALCFVVEGEEINLLGPLGTGFPALGKDKTLPVLIAGGYGNAALYLQAAALPVKGVAFFGGRTAGDILCVDEFEKLGWEVHITTDDGSLGESGLITAAIDPWLDRRKEQFRTMELFACGPNAMLKAVGDRAVDRGITAWLSMDRNMACGVGACLTCVIRRRTADGWEWARCCKDGPVFSAGEILWED